MNEMYSIAGKVAVISGAAGVLGGSLARHFASQGADVVALVHRAEQVESTLETLRAFGGRPSAYSCNVMDTAEVKKIAVFKQFAGAQVHEMCPRSELSCHGFHIVVDSGGQ